MTRRIWDFKAGFHDVLFKLPVFRSIKRSEIGNSQNLFRQAKNKGRVLEIGCGTGAYLDLYNSKSSVYGLDISIKMLEEAKKKDNIGCIFLCSSASHIPFQEGFFDFVSAIGLLEYFRDKETVLNEVRRVLVSGGSAVVSYTHESAFNIFRRVWKLKFYPSNEDEMQLLFESCGFAAVKTGKSLIQTQVLLKKL